MPAACFLSCTSSHFILEKDILRTNLMQLVVQLSKTVDILTMIHDIA